jgi:hypothetical protein
VLAIHNQSRPILATRARAIRHPGARSPQPSRRVALEALVRWFGRRSGRQAPSNGPTRADVEAALAHLRNFVASRRGVEMYVEPRTSVTPTTVVLIATSGEWTRRRISDPAAAGPLARELGVPVYDVQQTGYPARMREWTSQQRRGGGATA